MTSHRSRVLACLVLLVPIARVQAEPPPVFFAVLSDIQKPDNDPLAEFAWAIDQINAVAPDFVLIPGDMTATGTENQFANFAKMAGRLAVPWFCAVGNHDAETGQSIYAERFTRSTGRPTWYHQRLGGWHLVVLDSSLFTKGKLIHAGGIAPEEKEWLARELAAIRPEEPIVLALHFPLYSAGKPAGHAGILDAFAGHKLLCVVAGHEHRNSHFQDAAGIHHFTTGSLLYSTDPKDKSIGYRWLSAVGDDLWTAWIKTTDEPPLTLFRRHDGPGSVANGWWAGLPGNLRGRACVRVRYQGRGLTLSFHANAGADLVLAMPPAAQAATAMVPLSEEDSRRVFGGPSTAVMASGSDDAVLTEVAVYQTTADWVHYRLRP